MSTKHVSFSNKAEFHFDDFSMNDETTTVAPLSTMETIEKIFLYVQKYNLSGRLPVLATMQKLVTDFKIDRNPETFKKHWQLLKNTNYKQIRELLEENEDFIEEQNLGVGRTINLAILALQKGRTNFADLTGNFNATGVNKSYRSKFSGKMEICAGPSIRLKKKQEYKDIKNCILDKLFKEIKEKKSDFLEMFILKTSVEKNVTAAEIKKFVGLL